MIDPRVAAHLLDEETPPDPALGNAVAVIHEWRDWSRIRLDAGVVEQLREPVGMVVDRGATRIDGRAPARPWARRSHAWCKRSLKAREVQSSVRSRRIAHPDSGN